MSVSSQVSERALREIYFPAFEKVVKEAQPKTVMCSYNKINGVYASENEWLLTKILRDEWGFEGFVVSDWYAVSDRVKALKAGLDLEMPGGDRENDEKIVAAVRAGELSESVLDEAVERILKVVLDYIDNRRTAKFDRQADHQKAVKIAEECAVLLKNEGGLLPLPAGGEEEKKQDEPIFFHAGSPFPLSPGRYRGKPTVNRLPSGLRGRAVTQPPWRRTVSRTMDSPSPVPPAARDRALSTR